MLSRSISAARLNADRSAANQRTTTDAAHLGRILAPFVLYHTMILEYGMRPRTRFHYDMLPLVALLILTACGIRSSGMTSTLPPQAGTTPIPSIVPATPIMSPVASSTPVRTTALHVSSPDQTPVPMTHLSLTLKGRTWTLNQPQGLPPRFSANAHGILWLQYPSMETNSTIEQYGMDPLPRGPYQIWFTPLRSDGGDLAQAAEPILTLPSAVAGNTVHIVSITAAGSDHFLLRTYELDPNAQNGGTTRIRWIDPSAHASKEILNASEGGGKFLTIAQNDTWLFWNRYATGTTSLYAPDAQAGLIALHDGTNHAISLGAPNVANEAVWGNDGKLHFTTGQEQRHLIFDPRTNQVQTP